MIRRVVFGPLFAVALGLSDQASARSFVYVPNSGDGTVSVIDSDTNSVTATVSVGTSPGSVAVDPAGHRIYVGNVGEGTVSVIDGATNRVIATVPDLQAPIDLGITPTGGRLFVLNGTFGNGMLSVVDTATLTLLGRVRVGDSPAHLAMSSIGSRAYVTNTYDLRERRPCLVSPTAFCDLTMFAIDTVENRTIAQVVLGDDLGEVTVATDGHRVYATNKIVAQGNLVGIISVVDTDSDIVVDRITEPAFSLALAPDGITLYALTADMQGTHVAVIDVASKQVRTRVTAGRAPTSIGVNASGTRVYVVNTNDNSVSVMDTATNTLIATVPVGLVPFASGSFVGPELAESTLTPALPSTPTPTPTNFGQEPGCCVLSVGPSCATTMNSREFREKCISRHFTEFTPGYVCNQDTGACEPAPCVGDCNGDSGIAVDEIIVSVNVALGGRPVSDCRACDGDHDGTIGIAELVQAVGNALHGCNLAVPASGLH